MGFWSRSVYRDYQTHIRRLNRTGTWFPTDLLKLGEVGVLREGCFVRDTTLAELGIEFAVEAEGDANDDLFSHMSASQLSVRVDGKVEVPLGEGELGFGFAKSGQYVLSTRGLRHHRIASSGAVYDRIADLHREGKWRSEWIVIDELWTAKHLTAMVAMSRGASVVLAAKGGPLLSVDDLADVGLGASIRYQQGELWFNRAANATPFFSARKFAKQKSLHLEKISKSSSTRGLQDTGVAPGSRTRGPEDEAVELVPLHFTDDLLGSWPLEREDG